MTTIILVGSPVYLQLSYIVTTKELPVTLFQAVGN